MREILLKINDINQNLMFTKNQSNRHISVAFKNEYKPNLILRCTQSSHSHTCQKCKTFQCSGYVF
jgi:hypothetical protein